MWTASRASFASTVSKVPVSPRAWAASASSRSFTRASSRWWSSFMNGTGRSGSSLGSIRAMPGIRPSSPAAARGRPLRDPAEARASGTPRSRATRATPSASSASRPVGGGRIAEDAQRGGDRLERRQAAHPGAAPGRLPDPAGRRPGRQGEAGSARSSGTRWTIRRAWDQVPSGDDDAPGRRRVGGRRVRGRVEEPGAGRGEPGRVEGLSRDALLEDAARRGRGTPSGRCW